MAAKRKADKNAAAPGKAKRSQGRPLQSGIDNSREDLKSTSEELKRSNEELTTVNNQLQDKVTDLENANNDMANLLNCSDLAILFLDRQLCIKRFTPPATRLFNLIATDLDRPISDITAKFPDGTLQQDIDLVLRDLSPRESPTLTPDGTCWIRRITPYRTLDQRIEGVVVTFTDVTRIRQADAESRRLATVVRNSNDAVIIHDFDGKITAWNRGAQQMIGYTEAEALQMNVSEMVPEVERDHVRTCWEQVRRGESVIPWESQRRTRDGRILDVWITATALKDEAGRPVAIVKTERDITAKKAAEAELREQAERLSLALSAGAMGTWDWDLKTNTLIWDARQFELFGIRPEDFDHSAAQAMASIHPADRPRTQQLAALARDHGTPFQQEFRVVHPDGSIRWLVGLGRPLKNAEGETIRMIGVNFDISGRKETEQKLKDLNASLEKQVAERTQAAYEREERLRAVLKTAADAIITINSMGIIQTVNAATERLFGYTSAEMVGQNVKMLMPGPYRQEHDGYLEHYPQTGVKKIIGIGREVEARRKDGSTFPVELTVSEVDHLKLFTGIVRDITQRKQAEAALRESERFARSTLDALTAHIAIVDEDGVIEAVNQAWRNFATANGGDLKALTEGADYLHVCHRSTGFYSEEGPLVAKGIRAVLAGQLSDFTIEYPCHAPNVERWFVVRVTPFPGEGPRRVVVAHENITKRKELEREVVEIASLEQRRIGQDLHDSVGQELTALNMLAGDLPGVLQADPAHGAELVEQMARGLQRCQEELRAVMRGLLPVAVDAEGLMAALADLADRTQQEGKVACHFDCPEPVSVADNLTATHLYLIAQEAVHNAIKHARPRNIHIALDADEVLTLRVQDDGVGISQEPGDDHGGLGLRIMRNRAAIIGASLIIQPAEPTGTRVTCILTRTKREANLGRDAGCPPGPR